MESSKPVERTQTRGARRVGPCCGDHHSDWQCFDRLSNQRQQCFWNKHGPSATERHLLEKPAGEKRGASVETRRLFQLVLFYESASHWRGWHRNCVWGQRDGD